LASIFNSAAIIAMRQGQFIQGLGLYKSAVTYVSSESHVLARVFFNMGVGLMKWDKAVQALAAFEQAAALDVNFTKAIHNVEILKAQKTTGGPLTPARHIQELASLNQQDEVFGAKDFSASPTAGQENQ
jgi:hypothetical protein